MALRVERGAGDGRFALGRASFVGLAATLYLAAGGLAVWPAVRRAGDGFLTVAEPGGGGAAPGDHLQITYQLWLAGHNLVRGSAPWRDPYSFQPLAEPTAVFLGWLFALPWWAVAAAFGPVAAWNALALTSHALAGGFACAWLRELDLPRGAALAGGLAFALAPYRVAQSTNHLLGPVAALLPLALWAFERGRRGRPAWHGLAAAALAAIPLSGQLHLALGAIPFFLAYALARTRNRRALAGAAAAGAIAVGAGLLVRLATIEGSIAEGGRSLRAVGFYSVDPQDFVVPQLGQGLEHMVFLGWATPLAALVGLALLVRTRRYALGAALGLGALVPALLALGTHLPTYELLWRHVPGFGFPRVPARLMPIAVLAIAALVAFALARFRSPRVAAVALLALALDLRVPVYGTAAADPGNAAYAALRNAPAGRLLELPVFTPERHYASVYLYYRMQAPRAGPGGYSTVAPVVVADALRRLQALNCGRWGSVRTRFVQQLGIRYVAVHAGLYRTSPLVSRRCLEPATEALERQGYRLLAHDGAVTIYVRR
jgi:hypothetical protein